MDHIDTHEELGLLNIDTKIYFLSKDGLKYKLSNREIKICITKQNAHDWVKMIHKHKESHLTKEEVPNKVNKRPY